MQLLRQSPDESATRGGWRRGKNNKKKALDELEARCRLTSTVLLYLCSGITVTLHYSTTVLLYHCTERLYSHRACEGEDFPGHLWQ